MTRAAVIAAILLAAAALSFRPIYEPDLWWHLAQGRENAAQLTRTNLFSFTYPDYPQQYTPWLFDSSVFAAWTHLGPAGIQLFQALWLAVALALSFAAARRRAPPAAAAAVLLLGFFVLEPRAIPRPHLVSFAGLAACAWLVETSVTRRSAGVLAWALPLIAVWSNFHVECVFGVVLLGVFAVGELAAPVRLPRREAARALAIAAACVPATMVNPYGWGLLAYLYENLSVPAILAIAELRPPPLPAYRAFYAFVGLASVAAIWPLRAFALSDAAVALVFSVFGAMHLRETPLIVFAAGPLVASRLGHLLDRGVDYRALLVTAACAGWVLSRIPAPLLVTELSVGSNAVEPPQFFSRGAIEFARRSRLNGPVFTSHNLGGYLAWTMYPEVRVFQDSRLQAYPPEHFRAIIAASRSQPEWDLLVAGVEWAVVSVPRPNQLSGTGRFPAAQWKTVYQDDAMEIVVRRGGKFGGL